MARYSGKKRVSDETRAEVAKLARGTQARGQTKAQTRLIEKGIERGIDLYKKQQKEKARALDRQTREQRRRAGPAHDTQAALASGEIAEPPPRPGPRRQWRPWLLLGLTWAGMAAHWVLRNAGHRSVGRMPDGREVTIGDLAIAKMRHDNGTGSLEEVEQMRTRTVFDEGVCENFASAMSSYVALCCGGFILAAATQLRIPYRETRAHHRERRGRSGVREA